MLVDPGSIHECSECQFVASVECVYLRPNIVRATLKKPLYLGAYSWPGCSGHLHCYGILCPNCNKAFVDYPHGYTEKRWLFFNCRDCQEGGEIIGRRRAIVKIVDEEIYKREGIAFPEKMQKISPPKGFVVFLTDNDVTILVKGGSKAAQLLDQKIAEHKPEAFRSLLFWVCASFFTVASLISFVLIYWAYHYLKN